VILISHRGNINGPIPEKENSVSYINEALREGYDVEIDVWLINNELFLGHDHPDYKINLEFLLGKSLWCHAKSIDALEFLMSHDIRCFWHQSDDVTLTYPDMLLWTYAGKQLTKRSICCNLGKKNKELDSCYAVCSDYISLFKESV